MSGGRVVPEVVQYEVDSGVAWLRIARPEAFNALNEAVVTQLGEHVRRAIDDRAVCGLVIAAQGRAFVAGADLKFFVRCLLAGDVERLIQFTREGQKLFSILAASPKPVVARVQGGAVGGGVELALTCKYTIAAPAARFSFPETGLGIYPGLGGTQRLPRKIGVGLAKWLLYTGHSLTAEEAQRVGLVNRVCADEALDSCARSLIDQDPGPIVHSELSAEHLALQALFSHEQLESLLRSDVASRGAMPLDRVVHVLKTKAPLALRLTETLIDCGTQLPLAEALQLEIDHLREILTTEDARAGLSTLGQRRPVFVGR